MNFVIYGGDNLVSVVYIKGIRIPEVFFLTLGILPGPSELSAIGKVSVWLYMYVLNSETSVVVVVFAVQNFENGQQGKTVVHLSSF